MIVLCKLVFQHFMTNRKFWHSNL